MEIILIGPIGAGKSTIAELLAQQLDIPNHSLDDLRKEYYAEIGYDAELAETIRERDGVWGLYQYWKPFEIHAVERMLTDYPTGILDFGAGHSVYEDKALFERARLALAERPNVILLLPSPDFDETMRILNEREPDLPDEVRSLNEHFVRHPSNHTLATFTVYTRDKTPEETCEEILSLVRPEP